MHRFRGRAAQFSRRAAVPVLLVLLWQLMAWSGHLDTRFIPAPSTIARTWYLWVFGVAGPLGDPYVGTWLEHAAGSSFRVLVGFGLAAVLGITAGILTGYYLLWRDLLDATIEILRPIPITAWVPFAVVFFGIRAPSAIFLIVLGAFFAITVNTAAGVRRVPRSIIRAAQMLGTPATSMLPRVVFPAALPSIFTGLRVAMGLSWMLVVVAEMLAVRSGLGSVLWNAYYVMRMDVIVAAMLSVGLLGFLFDQLVVAISNYVLRWNEGR